MQIYSEVCRTVFNGSKYSGFQPRCVCELYSSGKYWSVNQAKTKGWVLRTQSQSTVLLWWMRSPQANQRPDDQDGWSSLLQLKKALIPELVLTWIPLQWRSYGQATPWWWSNFPPSPLVGSTPPFQLIEMPRNGPSCLPTCLLRLLCGSKWSRFQGQEHTFVGEVCLHRHRSDAVMPLYHLALVSSPPPPALLLSLTMAGYNLRRYAPPYSPCAPSQWSEMTSNSDDACYQVICLLSGRFGVVISFVNAPIHVKRAADHVLSIL